MSSSGSSGARRSTANTGSAPPKRSKRGQGMGRRNAGAGRLGRRRRSESRPPADSLLAARPSGRALQPRDAQLAAMIRKLKSGGFRLYSRKKDPRTGKRKNLGTFRSLAAAKRHERAVQFFKRH